MKIADIPLPTIKVPDFGAVRDDEIETDHHDVPFGAYCWIYCTSAWPHRDPSWPDDLFLTLSIRSDHSVGDAKSNPEIYVGPGSLFIIDPLTTHWLRPHNPDVLWIGLQWEIERKAAKRKVREIVEQLGGQWCLERGRYKAWGPK